jgi:hypothetical protein
MDPAVLHSYICVIFIHDLHMSTIWIELRPQQQFRLRELQRWIWIEMFESEEVFSWRCGSGNSEIPLTS